MMENNILCIKWGTKYGPEYVNNLYAMVERNITIPHKFICITDDPEGLTPGIHILPMQDDNIEEWWHKLTLFKPTIGDLTGRILFMDLDVVVMGNIDCFFNDHKFSIIKEWIAGRGFNSSVFSLEIGTYTYVWDNYVKELAIQQRPGRIKGQIRGYNGDQDWITKQIPNPSYTWPMEWVPSYKYCCEKSGPIKTELHDDGSPVGGKIVIFHGNPNPPDAIIGWKRWGPSPWIANYWKL